MRRRVIKDRPELSTLHVCTEGFLSMDNSKQKTVWIEGVMRIAWNNRPGSNWLDMYQFYGAIPLEGSGQEPF
jgi:hypothetical protein